MTLFEFPPLEPNPHLHDAVAYDVVYADPPWRYSFSRSKSRAIENQYVTMTVPDICGYLEKIRLPIKDDAVLYLWATAPKLIEALEVMKSWGFNYKTNMVWDKQRTGMGYWCRGQHELLLVGTRGKKSPPAAGLRLNSVQSISRTYLRHSEKPSTFREMIVSHFPTARRIELFARKNSDNWDAVGLELEQTEAVEAAPSEVHFEDEKAVERDT